MLGLQRGGRMRVRLKGLNSITKTLADGTRRTYWYAWKGGPPLRGEPGMPEFIASYNEAVARKVVPPRGTLLYLDSTKTREAVLTLGARWIRVWWMIRPGFLSAAERGALIVVARDGLVEHRVARRANAIVLLNDGWNCEEVGSALLLDDDTVREWFGVY